MSYHDIATCHDIYRYIMAALVQLWVYILTLSKMCEIVSEICLTNTLRMIYISVAELHC